MLLSLLLTVLQHPHWTTSFVGLGPYMLKHYVPGSHLILSANPNYVLGHPRIDEIELRIVLDENTVMSNLLAGTGEVLVGNTLTVDEGLELQNQWANAVVDYQAVSWLVIFPFINTDPPVIQNLQFRRALLYAMDRQQMVDTLQAREGGGDAQLPPPRSGGLQGHRRQS